MKVAVLSTVPTCGKSTFVEIFGGVYSRSQRREVVIFSTGDALDVINMVTNLAKTAELDNPYIVKSMVENANNEDADSLRNYGIQAGDEHVFIFDILNTTLQQAEKEEFLLSAIEKVPADMTLIEICGDPNSDLNKKVLNLCDCSIILTDVSIKGCMNLAEIFEKMPKCIALTNKALVMSRCNPIVASDKKISSAIKMRLTDIYKFPYNPVVGKLAFDGELDRICYNITVGDYNVSEFRMPLQMLMEFVYDTPTRKIIRSIDRWYK